MEEEKFEECELDEILKILENSEYCNEEKSDELKWENEENDNYLESG